MSTVMMEMALEEPASDEQIEAMKSAAEVCFEVNDIVRRRTYVSTDRKRFVCVMEARDVESARRALESARVPYGRIWAATSF
jgi:hypothetical protein